MFESLGGFVGKHPWLVIALCTAVAGGLSVGFMRLKVENRTDRLFIPQQSQALEDIDKSRNNFHDVDTRLETLIFAAKAVEKSFTVECLTEILSVHEAVINLKSFSKYCATQSGETAKSTDECMMLNFLEFFYYNQKNMTDIYNKITERQKSPEVMTNGRSSFYNFGRMFGNLKSNRTSGKLVGAEVIQVIYFMQNPIDNEYNIEVIEWEKLFIDKVSKLKNNLKCFTLYYAAERSINDAISESSGSDIGLFSITFTIMISFSCVILGKFRNPLMGHSLLSYAGIFAVVFGVMAGIGLCLLVGTPFVSLVGILPFLILGVGIDDMFILMDELDRQNTQLTVVQTIESVLAQTGATVTMTTLTDLVAFAVSTSTAFPAIKYFCIFAAVSITLSYIFMVTFFVAFMTFEIRRMKSGRRECLPLCRVPEVPQDRPPWYQPQTSQLANKAMSAWGRLLMLTPTRVIVVILSLGLLAAGVFGMLNIEEEFNRTLLAKDDSYFKDFIKIQERYFSSGMEVSVVIDSDIPYNDVNIQNDIFEVTELINNSSYYKNESVSWLVNLKSFVKTNNALVQQSKLPVINFTYVITYSGASLLAFNETVIRTAFTQAITSSLNVTSSRIAILNLTHDPINITFSVVDVLRGNLTSRLQRLYGENKMNLYTDQGNMSTQGFEVVTGTSLPQEMTKLQPMNLSGPGFMSALKAFLKHPSFMHHEANVKLSKDNDSIKASRIMVFMKSSTSSIFQRDAMLSIRKDLKAKSNLMAYATAKSFKFFEQYALTLSETTRNLAIAAATIVVITWPFLVDIRATLLVFFGFAALVVELFALMYIWNLSLNSITMINLVMAIGFAVDYSAHIAHAFVTSQEETPEERAVSALETLGASVLMGGEMICYVIFIFRLFARCIKN